MFGRSRRRCQTWNLFHMVVIWADVRGERECFSDVFSFFGDLHGDWLRTMQQWIMHIQVYSDLILWSLVSSKVTLLNWKVSAVYAFSHQYWPLHLTVKNNCLLVNSQCMCIILLNTLFFLCRNSNYVSATLKSHSTVDSSTSSSTLCFTHAFMIK